MQNCAISILIMSWQFYWIESKYWSMYINYRSFVIVVPVFSYFSQTIAEKIRSATLQGQNVEFCTFLQLYWVEWNEIVTCASTTVVQGFFDLRETSTLHDSPSKLHNFINFAKSFSKSKMQNFATFFFKLHPCGYIESNWNIVWHVFTTDVRYDYCRSSRFHRFQWNYFWETFDYIRGRLQLKLLSMSKMQNLAFVFKSLRPYWIKSKHFVTCINYESCIIDVHIPGLINNNQTS